MRKLFIFLIGVGIAFPLSFIGKKTPSKLCLVGDELLAFCKIVLDI